MWLQRKVKDFIWSFILFSLDLRKLWLWGQEGQDAFRVLQISLDRGDLGKYGAKSDSSEFIVTCQHRS